MFEAKHYITNCCPTYFWTTRNFYLCLL